MLIKERLEKYSATVSDSDLLGIILGVEPFADVNLRELSKKSIRELQALPGIGEKKAIRLKACLELARRFEEKKIQKGVQCNNPNVVFSHFHARLRDESREKFFVLLLDTKNQLIREELVSIGTLNGSLVHPREVFAPALAARAANVILVHNHPSGDPTPSPEDRAITTRLVSSGEMLGVKILDHIVIGDGCYVSLQEQHLL